MVPLICWGAAALVVLDASEWQSSPAAIFGTLMPEAMLWTAAAVIVGAPLLGVVLSRPRDQSPPRGTLEVLRAAIAAVSALVGGSAAVTLASVGLQPRIAGIVFESHATLAATALALTLAGAACAAALDDPLDAAGVSLAMSLVVSVGLLVGGAGVGDAPRWLVSLALMASPLVAVASATQVDIVRMEPLYQMSPLAHLSIDYPTWYAALAWHLAMAIVCGALMICMQRTWANDARNMKGHSWRER
jgi:hypothetical protein